MADHQPTTHTRLDALDRQLLALIDQDPTASFSRLADEVEVSARTVARRLTRLQDNGVVRVIGRTLPGFGERLAWLVRVQASPDVLGPLATAMAKKRRTRWVRLSRDRGELMCGLLTSPSGEDEVMNQLMQAAPVRSTRVHQLLQVWGGDRDAITTPTRQLDQLDQRILGLLARDGRLDAAALGQQLGIDPSTAARRRRRLVEEGILYFEADIHPAAIGGSGDAMLWIRMVPGHLEQLAGMLRDRREVRFVAATSGECSLVANVVLPDPASLLTFVDGLTDYGITDVEIVLMGRVLKRTA